MDDKGLMDTVVVLDEAGLFLKSSQDAEEYQAALRKMNVVILLPSVQPPTSRLKFLTVYRAFNLETLGIPGWLYKYHLKVGYEHESDWFLWWNPSEIYGIYSTEDFPSDDEGIGTWIAGQKDELQRRQGRTRVRRSAVTTVTTVAGMASMASSGGDATDIVSAAETFAEAAEVFSISSNYRSKRRR
ncbi:MAG: hypothetical protein VB089_21360 [Anaerolineaceae bacterium]|nr:hypothetical protein [Anaerolineaceae bacterium]